MRCLVYTQAHIASASVPILIYGVLTTVCALLLCRLPDTSHCRLPDLISDVETTPVTAWPERPPSSSPAPPAPPVPSSPHPQGPIFVTEAVPDNQVKNTSEV